MYDNKIFSITKSLIDEVAITQEQNIKVAARAIVETIKKGGIIQAFGSGHSICGAMEIYHRYGGLAPVKKLAEPSGGIYERMEGIGRLFLKDTEILPEDIVIVISHSGKNALPCEVALVAKERKATVIAVTSVKASSELPTGHSCGKHLFEIADIVLDTQVAPGDAMAEVEGLDSKICGMSSIITGIILQATVLESVEMMVAEGIKPPVRFVQSKTSDPNVLMDIEKQYSHRLLRK
ncbi:MAG: sugar isomerase domain-containing protein [Erysipelotrichaceae bacterium]|nr:sugar isomerase domain-containing protein [Erysipelotrichaceae bacterium]